MRNRIEGELMATGSERKTVEAWSPSRQWVHRAFLGTSFLAAMAAGCGGGHQPAVQANLATVSRSGGDASFRLIDEASNIRRDIEEHLGPSLLAVRLEPNEDGLVYIGEVIPDCFPQVQYRFRGTRPRDEIHRASNQTSDGLSTILSSALVGVDESAFESSQIRLISVGTYISTGALPEAPDDARCKTATHALTKVEVGAMEMQIAGTNSDSGSLGFGALGLESGQESQSGSVIREGQMDECKLMSPSAVAPPDGCRVPLRAKVEPLPRTAADVHLSGSYTCGDSDWTTRMSLHIDAAGVVSGSVAVASDDEVGRWGLAGTIEGSSLSLEPVEPLDLPMGYSPVGFEGTLTGGEFVGTADSCGSVRLDVAEGP